MGGALPVIITHNAIVSVALEIAFVYYDIFIPHSQGFLSQEIDKPILNEDIWKMFKKYNNTTVKFDMTFGQTRKVNLDFLSDENFLRYLKQESELLSLISKFSKEN